MIGKLSNVKRYRAFFVLIFAIMLLHNCASQGASQKQSLVWPDNPYNPPRIELIEILQPQDFKTHNIGSLLLEFVLGKSAESELLQPFGVAVDSTGNVYVVSSGKGLVNVFDRQNNDIRTFGKKGDLIFPTDILLIDSLVYVSDGRRQQIVVFDKSGELVKRIGRPGDLMHPGGMAFQENSNRLYVTDSQSHRIAVFDLNSGLLDTTIGTRGSGDAQFNFPVNIATGNEKLYVVDAMNFRIQILSLEGDFISAFGQAGDSAGDLYRPKGIGLTSDGFLFVTDSQYNNIQIFDESGNVYLSIGVPGSGAGEFSLPADLAVDNRDRIYVTDSKNSRVQVFQYIKYD